MGLQCTKRHSELATILVKHNGRSTHLFFGCASCCGGRFFWGNLKNLTGQIQGWWHLSSISLLNHVETTWLGSRNLHCRPLATLMEGLLATCNISTCPRTEAFAMKWTEHYDGTQKIKGDINSDKQVGKKFSSFKKRLLNQLRPLRACQRGEPCGLDIDHHWSISKAQSSGTQPFAGFPVKLTESSSCIDVDCEDISTRTPGFHDMPPVRWPAREVL